MKQIYDLTLGVGDTTLRFPGDPAPRCTTSYAKHGDATLRFSMLEFSPHVGTHVDAPGHFVEGGLLINQIPAGVFVGDAVVFDLTRLVGPVIGREVFAGLDIARGARVFLKTRNSELLGRSNFCEDHVYLSRDAASHLVERGIAMLCFDYYNLDSSVGTELHAHTLFGGAGIPVVVAANMMDVPAGVYFCSAAPILVDHCEAAPVRVLLCSGAAPDVSTLTQGSELDT